MFLKKFSCIIFIYTTNITTLCESAPLPDVKKIGILWNGKSLFFIHDIQNKDCYDD